VSPFSSAVVAQPVERFPGLARAARGGTRCEL
jgi:hypothetical protein